MCVCVCGKGGGGVIVLDEPWWVRVGLLFVTMIFFFLFFPL